MKWYKLMSTQLLVYILFYCLPSVKAEPYLSKSTKDIREEVGKRLKVNGQTALESETLNVPNDDTSCEEESNGPSPLEIPKERLSDSTEKPFQDDFGYVMEGLTTTASPASGSSHRWHPLIYPGTKWCGNGNIASSDDDLGTEAETDMCCRDHDNCEEFILGGEKKYNLINKSAFTSLSCECDKKLYECLQRTNTTVSHAIGNLYFNILKRECFELINSRKCKTYATFLRVYCIEYEEDIAVAKVYQWTPSRKYERL